MSMSDIEALASLDLEALPDDVIPLEAIVLIKAFDENGEVAWYQRLTDGLSDFEAVGALVVAADLVKQGCIDGFMSSEDDDDEYEE